MLTAKVHYGWEEVQRDVALLADWAFAQPLETTLKSICYHNGGIRFHLLNREFAPEWFHLMNQYLAPLGCEIRDIKIPKLIPDSFKTYAHISQTTYYRYWIPHCIEADTVLYLDADVLVNDDIHHLFDLDLGNYYLIATTDYIAETLHGKSKDYFNAGVMLINNRLWKEHRICERALACTAQGIAEPEEADQGVLNHLLGHCYWRTHRFFNYQVGLDCLRPQQDNEQLVNTLPFIIHFNTRFKPWLADYSMRFRSWYWFYHGLNWSDIAQRHQAYWVAKTKDIQ